MWFYRTFRHLDAATRSGRYGCTSGPISMHEQSDMGSATRAITDRVTKQIVTIFSKTCNKTFKWDMKGNIFSAVNLSNVLSFTFENGIPGISCTLFEPTHEIMALIALRKLSLQTRMCRNPLGLHVWYLVRPFVYFHTLCVRTAKALIRAVSPEPLLFAYAISTIISWAGSFRCRQTISRAIFSNKLAVKMCNKHFEDRLKNKDFKCKHIFE